jgi:thermitase
MNSLKSSIVLAFLVSAVSIADPGLPPFYDSLKNWGLVNHSHEHSAVDATYAWRYETGDQSIVVAVIDTGIDASHRDLTANLWHDPNHPEQNIYGWNFIVDQPNPFDDHGHGTHVAGIIGAVFDPQSGVSGVAQHVSIMPVKYYSDSNSGAANVANTIMAINYAVNHGARIINYSGGGPEFNEDEYIAIRKAEAKGILFVAAAGNEHQDTDQVENYYYPSAYRLSNIISVAAIDIHNQLIPSSNWGFKKVDLAAPGENIYSTLPGGRYGYMSGTSQATPFVSGTAALILSCHPNLTPQQVRSLILSSVDKEPTLEGKVATGGKLNTYRSLAMEIKQYGKCANDSKVKY